jgi:hypothetical protein
MERSISTVRRALIGFLLRRLLQKLAFQTLGRTLYLLLQMTQILVTGLNAPVQTHRQTRLPVNHWSGKRLETAVGVRNRVQALLAHAPAYTTPLPKLPPQILRCAPRPLARLKFFDAAAFFP